PDRPRPAAPPAAPAPSAAARRTSRRQHPAPGGEQRRQGEKEQRRKGAPSNCSSCLPCSSAPPLLRSSLPLSPLQDNGPVRGSALEDLALAVGPVALDLIDPAGAAQAEVGTGVVAAQVTEGRVDQAQVLPASGTDAHLCAVGVTVQSRIDSADNQPVASIRCNVAIQPGAAGDRRHQQVERSIAVYVADRQPAGHVPRPAPGPLV